MKMVRKEIHIFITGNLKMAKNMGMENKYKMMLFMKDFSKKVKYMVMEGVYILL